MTTTRKTSQDEKCDLPDCQIELARTKLSPAAQRYMRQADRQARSMPRSEVRMLTPSEIESLQRDKAESGKRMQAMFKAHREKKGGA